MIDSIKKSLETIKTTNNKNIYQTTVQKVTSDLEAISDKHDKKELIELIKQAYHEAVRNAERFGYMSLEDEVTEEKIKTIKCFNRLLDLKFKLTK